MAKAHQIQEEKIDEIKPVEKLIIPKPEKSEMQLHLEIMRDKSRDIFESLGTPDFALT